MLRAAHPPSSARRAMLAVATLAVAWVVVVAELATTLHFALISHEVCAVHGELVHRAAAGIEHAAHHATGTAALPGGGEADDDHCPLLARPHDQLAVVASSRIEVVPPALDVSTPGTAGVTVAPSRAVLLLTAPKQSPPA